MMADEVHSTTEALWAAREEMIFRLSLAVEYRHNETGEQAVPLSEAQQVLSAERGKHFDPRCVEAYPRPSAVPDPAQIINPAAVLAGSSLNIPSAAASPGRDSACE